MTEALLAQHLESPSRTGRGRVPNLLAINTASATRYQRGYSNSTTTILTGQSALLTVPDPAEIWDRSGVVLRGIG